MKIFEAYTKARIAIHIPINSIPYKLGGHNDMYYPIFMSIQSIGSISFDFPTYLQGIAQNAIDFPDQGRYLLLEEWKRVRKL